MLREEKDEVKPRVSLYDWKRNAFNKTGFNENHIPSQGGYAKVRANKPKLDAWENPKFDWPPKLPRATEHKGKALLDHCDKEEKDRIIASREFEMPDFRSGDVLKFTKWASVSEKIEKEYHGICFSKKAQNSIRAGCKINFNIDTVNVVYGLQFYSPLLTGFEITKYGSNKLRKKLNYIPKLDMSTGRLLEPVIRGRGYHQRSAKAKKIQIEGKKSNRGKLRKGSVELDTQEF